MTWLLVALGGALGALARWSLDLAARRAVRSPVPVGILAVNALGSLGVGLAAGLAAHGLLPPTAATVVETGLLGGFTTFSTACLESVLLLRERRAVAAAALGAAHVLVCAAGAAAGLALAALGR
jgi:CrcB protein